MPIPFTLSHKSLLKTMGCPDDVITQIEKACPVDGSQVTLNVSAFIILLADIKAGNWAAIPGDLIAAFG